MKRIITSLLFVITVIGCTTDADIASRNLSKDADMFRVPRRIIFYNGITDTYMLNIEGYCSLNLGRESVVTVTCKTAPDEYKKHYLGLSDNVTYFAEQLEPKSVSQTHYKVIFKPLSIIPDVELRK